MKITWLKNERDKDSNDDFENVSESSTADEAKARAVAALAEWIKHESLKNTLRGVLLIN